MTKVSVNAPRTPVTEGSSGIAAATLPNVCKMPGPPAPFVPTPLPNIGKSGTSPKGYSQTVTIEGKKVAIRGATFGSTGDVASKGTGGGIVSSNVEGPTSFVGPGSMNVKIEGKNVQLLGDPMLNNCGPSGSPPNSATMMGVFQANGTLTVVTGNDQCPACHETHGEDGALHETKDTKAQAEKLAQELSKQQYTRSGMLGAVRCRCEKNIYADRSGYEKSAAKHNKFCATVKGLSYIGPPDREEEAATGKKPVSVEDFLNMRPGLDKEALKEAWDEAQDRNERFERVQSDPTKAPPAYPPGSCAGPKALVLAMEKGASPASLSEVWFRMPKPDDDPNKPPVTKVYYRITEGAKPILGEFKPGDTVPPCDSCNIVVPLLICPKSKVLECPSQHQTEI
jgi:uncharacterized Zn-binding protein involved in type VI secretion